MFLTLFLLDGSDYTPTPIDVVFGPDELVTVIVLDALVNITDDIVVEDTEMFMATLSTTNPNVLFRDDIANITIFDNDGEKMFEKFNFIFSLA